ncbi:MAG: YeeE/YedE family protein [Thermoguttaceae bacterium]|nr:YeeE/YedE family protein [Thermoguttaceae bacterium]MDW8037662.1 YeeE/YedE thiosulfate transporter family protein [Thermoguttaceae bacterium]
MPEKNVPWWRPYAAGALLGVVAIASAWATTRWLGKTNYLGASTTFVRAAGLLEKTVAPDHVAQNAYFTKEKVRVEWQFMLIVGILIGALVGAVLDRSFRLEAVPPVWRERFGPSPTKRAIAALLGGAVMMIGARMADGCTSGNGLSGLMQLSASGFLVLPVFFGVALVTAMLVYGRRTAP